MHFTEYFLGQFIHWFKSPEFIPVVALEIYLLPFNHIIAFMPDYLPIFKLMSRST